MDPTDFSSAHERCSLRCCRTCRAGRKSKRSETTDDGLPPGHCLVFIESNHDDNRTASTSTIVHVRYSATSARKNLTQDGLRLWKKVRNNTQESEKQGNEENRKVVRDGGMKQINKEGRKEKRKEGMKKVREKEQRKEGLEKYRKDRSKEQIKKENNQPEGRKEITHKHLKKEGKLERKKE
jgi:hypothetical protein